MFSEPQHLSYIVDDYWGFCRDNEKLFVAAHAIQRNRLYQRDEEIAFTLQQSVVIDQVFETTIWHRVAVFPPRSN